MSGWMKYPYQECLDCEKYDLEEDEDWAIVNYPSETCAAENEDCPGRLKEADQANREQIAEEWLCPGCGAWEEDERFCCTCQADKWDYGNVKTRTKEAPAHD